MKISKGFTLIELMIVVAIIGILAAVSLPSYQNYIRRAEMVEALSLATTLREDVTEYYRVKYGFPATNAQLGVPAADKLIGNRVSRIDIEDGAIHITMGHKINQMLQGKVLTLRPAVVEGSPTSPISWLCGYDEAVTGMKAIGDNKTDIPSDVLPHACRKPYR